MCRSLCYLHNENKERNKEEGWQPYIFCQLFPERSFDSEKQLFLKRRGEWAEHSPMDLLIYITVGEEHSD